MRCSMDAMKLISATLGVSLLSGCSTMPGAQGPGGPRLVGSGQATEYGQYAEIGVEFSSVGDFVALVSPSRWKSPVATGGSLSWINPVAWGNDPGRTGRILLGEVVVVGAIAAGASAGGGGGGGGGSDSESPSEGTASGPSSPPPSIPSTPPM